MFFVRLPVAVPQKQNFKYSDRILCLLRNQFLAGLYGVGCAECALAYQIFNPRHAVTPPDPLTLTPLKLPPTAALNLPKAGS